MGIRRGWPRCATRSRHRRRVRRHGARRQPAGCRRPRRRMVPSYPAPGAAHPPLRKLPAVPDRPYALPPTSAVPPVRGRARVCDHGGVARVRCCRVWWRRSRAPGGRDARRSRRRTRSVSLAGANHRPPADGRRGERATRHDSVATARPSGGPRRARLWDGDRLCRRAGASPGPDRADLRERAGRAERRDSGFTGWAGTGELAGARCSQATGCRSSPRHHALTGPRPA